MSRLPMVTRERKGVIVPFPGRPPRDLPVDRSQFGSIETKAGQRLEVAVLLEGSVADEVRTAALFAGKTPQQFVTDFCAVAFTPRMLGR